jgi:hypothetical protein
MKKIRRFLCSSFLWVLLAPYLIFGIGAASNQVVLIANHDAFPVLLNPVKLAAILPDDAVALPPGRSQMIDTVHETMTKDTRLNALADIFDLGSIYSIGDFAIILGLWLNTFAPFVWGVLVFKKCWDADAV